MNFKLRQLGSTDVTSMTKLIETAYESERQANPLMPMKLLGEKRSLALYLEKCITNIVVGIEEEGKLLGYMGVSEIFPFKGQQTALMSEVSHATIAEDKKYLYESLYEEMGAWLKQKNTQLHIIANFAYDDTLKNTLYHLGFGLFLAERVRDTSAIRNVANVEIVEESDFLSIQDLEMEHMKYYWNAPIYLNKDSSVEHARKNLLENQKRRNKLFVCHENDSPAAYCIAGPCTGEGEGKGLILGNTNTAALLSVYAKPEVRNAGTGKALLDKAVAWARVDGYSRIFVEHETANLIGSRFWEKHFRPYLYFSMRYVEKCS